MIVAFLISVLVFFTLLLMIEIESTWRLERENIEQQARIFTIAAQVQDEIISRKLSLSYAQEIDWDDESVEINVADAQSIQYLQSYFYRHYDGSDEEDEIETGTTPEGLSYIQIGNAYLFDIIDADSSGNLLIYSTLGETITSLFTDLSALASIACFFLLTLRLFRPIFHYIKKIEEGVQVIATEDLTYKIETIGNNELTSLAREINKMGQEIYQKTEKEKQLEQSQRTLITNISHDLRTPLTSILGYIDLIGKNPALKDKVLQYSEIAKKNAIRLERLIDDLFLYTKLTSDDLKFEFLEVDINLVVGQMIELRSGNYNVKTSTGKLMTYLDIGKLHRVLDNLFVNAEKYGLDGELIDVTTALEDNFVCITISNKTKEDLSSKINHLSDRLYVANDERKEGSSGLGLSIAKDMIEKMKGEIKLDYHHGMYTVTLKFNKL